MSENSTEMPKKTRKNFLRSLQAKAIQAKNRVVAATRTIIRKIWHGSRTAVVETLRAAARVLRYIGVGILTVAQYFVLTVNMILLWISLAVMTVLNALYKVVLGFCLALMTPHDYAIGGKGLVKDNWGLYFAGWKPRNYFTLTLGEVARAEGLREQVIFDAQEDDEPAPAQQPKGRPAPKRRPHPRRVRPTVVPA